MRKPSLKLKVTNQITSSLHSKESIYLVHRKICGSQPTCYFFYFLILLPPQQVRLIIQDSSYLSYVPCYLCSPLSLSLRHLTGPSSPILLPRFETALETGYSTKPNTCQLSQHLLLLPPKDPEVSLPKDELYLGVTSLPHYYSLQFLFSYTSPLQPLLSYQFTESNIKS